MKLRESFAPSPSGGGLGEGALQERSHNNAINTTFNLVGACQASLLWPGVTATGNNPPTQRVAQCGEMKTWTIGLNWYLNDYTRLMFDYSQSDLRDYPITPASLNPGGTKAGFDGATIRGFGMRAQIDW